MFFVPMPSLAEMRPARKAFSLQHTASECRSMRVDSSLVVAGLYRYVSLSLVTIAGRLALAVHATPLGGVIDIWLLVTGFGFRESVFIGHNEETINQLLVSHVELRSYECNERTRSRTGSLHTRHTRHLEMTSNASLVQNTAVPTNNRELHNEPHIWRHSPLITRIVMTHDGLTSEVTPLGPY
jgi:hypothetical protein